MDPFSLDRHIGSRTFKSALYTNFRPIHLSEASHVEEDLPCSILPGRFLPGENPSIKAHAERYTLNRKDFVDVPGHQALSVKQKSTNS